MMNSAPPSTSAVAIAAPTATAGTANLPVVPAEKDKDSQWYFTAEELANSPSRRQGIDSDTELSYRQMTAYLIQEMGQRLKVSQLCINTAIVYMHRFYAFHSFTHFHRNGIASASLFLAAKVEEQPRKLEHVIRAANKCLNQNGSNGVDAFNMEQAQDLVFNENVLLQTLGFDVAIDHPHTHVVKTCALVKACKDLTKTSYFLASNSLHLTSMCLQYRPTVVACFCIYLACKWSRWEIPQSTEGKHWFHYVDKTVTMDLLKQLTDEFIAIYEKSPARLKSKLNSIKALAQGSGNNRPVGKDSKKMPSEEWKMSDMLKMYHSSITISENSNQSGGSSEHQQQQQQHSPHMNMPPMLPPQQQPLQQQMQNQQQQQQTQQKPTQQMRKSDMHSSQHRSQSHHSKHGYPNLSGGDMTDHKSSYKNQSQQSQPGYNGSQNSNAYSNTGRAPLPPPGAPANQSSRSSMSVPSSSRSIPPNSGHSGPLPNQRQPVSSGSGGGSGMPMDSHNYQKMRERSSSMHTIPSGMHNALPPSHSSSSAHKLPSKGDNAGRMMPLKESSSSKHKIFGGSSSSAQPAVGSSQSSGMREYSSNQAPPSSSSSSKVDVTHDMARNMMQQQQQQQQQQQHNQRSYSGNNNLPINNPVLGNLGYNMPSSTQHRQSNSSTSSATSTSSVQNLKAEHNKTMSTNSGNPTAVHMQTQLHKPNMPNEASSYTNPPTNVNDMQHQQQKYSSSQQQQPQAPHGYSSMMRAGSGSFDNVASEDQLNSMYSSMGQQQQTTHNPIKTSAPSNMFGVNEGLDSKMSHSMGMTSNTYSTMETNGSHRSNQMANVKNDGGGLSPRSSQSAGRDKERERFKVSPSTKKEKHRHSIGNPTAASSTSTASSFNADMDSSSGGMGSQHKSMEYMYSKKNEAGRMAAATNATNSGAGIKRPLYGAMKTEEDHMQRESKVHKLDASIVTSVDTYLPHPSVDTKVGDMGKLGHVVNGIETNPDMVRSLLKESLCPPSALIKSEPLLTAPESKPPAELFATPHIKDETSSTMAKTFSDSSKPMGVSADRQPTAAVSSVLSGEGEAGNDGKDREKHKKNKKEKHKHKEKDKSKDRDREERKKHKKDKDRHKERERERSSGGGSGGNGGSSGAGGSGDTTRGQRSDSERPTESYEPFKIKIRKDFIEGSHLNPPPFKIKIPKDRITGDLNVSGGIGSSSAGTSHHHNATISAISGGCASSAAGHGSGNIHGVTASLATSSSEQKPHNPTLKIKISKDKIENYTGSSYHQQHSVSASTAPPPLLPPPASIYSTSQDQQQGNLANSSIYSSHYTLYPASQTTASGSNNSSSATIGMSTAAGTHSHSHSHHSSSGSSSGGSSKKKDRDRSRDRDRDKKRHCSESNRSSLSANSSGGGSNNLPTVSSGSTSHSSHSSSGNSHSSRTHSSSKH